MSNASIRRLIGGLGALLVFLICGVLIGIGIYNGWNIQTIRMDEYTVVKSDGNGGYTAELDVDRLIMEERLMNPTPGELEKHPDQYPEIRVLRNLVYMVNAQNSGESYVLSLQLRPGVLDEKTDANAFLKKYGIELKNVVLKLSRAEMQALERKGEEAAGDPRQDETQPTVDKSRLDLASYVRANRNESGDYEAKLDVYRLLTDAGIDPKTDPETNAGAKALRSLAVTMEKTAEGYAFQTTSTLPTVMEDLKNAGIGIVNTKWTWTEGEMATHEGAVIPLPEPGAAGEPTSEPPTKTDTIDFPLYVCTRRTDAGEWTADVDTLKILTDVGIDPNADPETNPGLRAIRSLGVMVQKGDDGYTFQTTSALATVMDDLKTAGLGIKNTKWTWTEAETAAHEGSVTTTPTAEPTPDQNAEASESPWPTFNDVVGDTPTPAPKRNENAIDTLYGFDQTEVRKAIRAAKEQKYGSNLESSEIKYNCFAVGNEAAEHANAFRIVYTITKTTGTEYLVADVYDLENETGYKADDVHLTVFNDSGKARSIDDLKDYKVHTLSGGSMVFPENEGKSPFNDDGLVMPKSTKESVSYDELWDIPATDDLTLLQLLGYARNEMFARGGHQFGDSSNYQKFYSKYSWYKPTGKVSADDLAKMFPATKGNITTIKFLENLIKNG